MRAVLEVNITVVLVFPSPMLFPEGVRDGRRAGGTMWSPGRPSLHRRRINHVTARGSARPLTMFNIIN